MRWALNLLICVRQKKIVKLDTHCRRKAEQRFRCRNLAIVVFKRPYGRPAYTTFLGQFFLTDALLLPDFLHSVLHFSLTSLAQRVNHIVRLIHLRVKYIKRQKCLEYLTKV